ncbi:MAG TPA: DNA-processing protein DprA [Chloroflexota bacterium]|nr:DNA-processing protein DprA [Chloroflexota bacterium]
MDDRERSAWVAFNRVPGVGVARFRKLLERFGTLTEAWAAQRDGLALAGLDRRSLDAVTDMQRRLEPERELERARATGAAVITWRDAEYPALLSQIPDPPPVLYVKGTLLPEETGSVAMVGTRRATVYGRDVAERLAQDLATAGLAVVSGLAKGIDTHAHRGALAGSGPTIAVLGHGIDTLYPHENRRLAEQIVAQGALVTDYPVGTEPMAENFPPRNRIISGLSAGVIVVEADDRSGALITNKYAMEQDRDVFAIPGPISAPSSRGCNRLIQDGAKLVTSAADVLSELNPHLTAAAVRQLSLDFGGGAKSNSAGPAIPGTSGADDPLLTALREYGQPVHVDTLSRSLGKPVHEVTGTLTLLELQGKVRHAGGMRYQAAL